MLKNFNLSTPLQLKCSDEYLMFPYPLLEKKTHTGFQSSGIVISKISLWPRLLHGRGRPRSPGRAPRSRSLGFSATCAHTCALRLGARLLAGLLLHARYSGQRGWFREMQAQFLCTKPTRVCVNRLVHSIARIDLLNAFFFSHVLPCASISLMHIVLSVSR